MRILLIERDLEEMKGVKWYLKTYLSSNLEIESTSNQAQALEYMKAFQPHVIIIEIELVNASIEQMLLHLQVHVITVTAQPIFQHAMKAIQIQAIQLFIKPIPLDHLKSTLLSLNLEKETYIPTKTGQVEAQLYLDLYLNAPTVIDLSVKQFFIIEPSDFEQNLALYHWLIKSPIFNAITAFPLQKRILCIVEIKNRTQLVKQIRVLIHEWHVISGEYMNVAIYDGEDTTLREMYGASRKVLIQRFYKGYEHIFFSSEHLALSRLDPLLTPEEQQLWISSLEACDISAIKEFLYRLSQTNTYYHHEDVRIHLTSVLAQIRRFMMKYNLQQQAKIETHYRKLFHLILEHPILYAIIEEIILFTQSLFHFATQARQLLQADYSELAIEVIAKRFNDPSLSLITVAKELGISPNYLSNVFSRKQGVPFKRFLQQFRIQQSTRLLMETNFPISEVAEMCGFVDANYFTKVFRLQNGMTPFRYRGKVRLS